MEGQLDNENLLLSEYLNEMNVTFEDVIYYSIKNDILSIDKIKEIVEDIKQNKITLQKNCDHHYTYLYGGKEVECIYCDFKYECKYCNETIRKCRESNDYSRVCVKHQCIYCENIIDISSCGTCKQYNCYCGCRCGCSC